MNKTKDEQELEQEWDWHCEQRYMDENKLTKPSPILKDLLPGQFIKVACVFYWINIDRSRSEDDPKDGMVHKEFISGVHGTINKVDCGNQYTTRAFHDMILREYKQIKIK